MIKKDIKWAKVRLEVVFDKIDSAKLDDTTGTMVMEAWSHLEYELEQIGKGKSTLTLRGWFILLAGLEKII